MQRYSNCAYMHGYYSTCEYMQTYAPTGMGIFLGKMCKFRYFFYYPLSDAGAFTVLALGIFALGFFCLVWVIFIFYLFVALNFEKNICIILEIFAAHLFSYFLFWIYIYIYIHYLYFPTIYQELNSVVLWEKLWKIYDI